MPMKKYRSLQILRADVINCAKCSRLVHYRESIEKRSSYQEQQYWRKPVPGYGDMNAEILLLGLAPSTHGGNRTGRIFTGDESGRFLMDCLYTAGLANQKTSEYLDDGLILKNCYMTAIVKCVPPKNIPYKSEQSNCSAYWINELALLKKVKVIIPLGQMAYKALISYAKQQNYDVTQLQFVHNQVQLISNFFYIIPSYHPSPQNTYTKKLTKQMMVNLLKKAKEL
jgi:uracil-DNA glycosylase family 4